MTRSHTARVPAQCAVCVCSRGDSCVAAFRASQAQRAQRARKRPPSPAYGRLQVAASWWWWWCKAHAAVCSASCTLVPSGPSYMSWHALRMRMRVLWRELKSNRARSNPARAQSSLCSRHRVLGAACANGLARAAWIAECRRRWEALSGKPRCRAVAQDNRLPESTAFPATSESQSRLSPAFKVDTAAGAPPARRRVPRSR